MAAYYPTHWPYKGAVVEGTEDNEDLVPVLISTLRGALEFWKAQDIQGREMQSLLRNSKLVLNKAERAFEDPRYEAWTEKYRLIYKLSDTLDKLAPEGLYFGAAELTLTDYGFWDAEDLIDTFDVVL